MLSRLDKYLLFSFFARARAKKIAKIEAKNIKKFREIPKEITKEEAMNRILFFRRNNLKIKSLNPHHFDEGIRESANHVVTNPFFNE